jgi:hypothetical protein
MPAIPMSDTMATTMADDWLALRAKWAEVPTADRAEYQEYFQLAPALLDTGTRQQLINAYKGL